MQPVARLIPLAMTAALVGCNAHPANTTASGNASNDLTPESGTSISALLGGGKPVPLDHQARANNGMILQLTSIQAKPTETIVGVRIVNGADKDVYLNWNDQKTFLVAGSEKLFVSPPMDNPKLKVTQGASMNGQLVFLGRLPSVEQAALVINDGYSDGQYSDTPSISVPVQLPAGAFSDDGSKKN